MNNVIKVKEEFRKNPLSKTSTDITVIVVKENGVVTEFK